MSYIINSLRYSENFFIQIKFDTYFPLRTENERCYQMKDSTKKKQDESSKVKIGEYFWNE